MQQRRPRTRSFSFQCGASRPWSFWISEAWRVRCSSLYASKNAWPGPPRPRQTSIHPSAVSTKGTALLLRQASPRITFALVAARNQLQVAVHKQWVQHGLELRLSRRVEQCQARNNNGQARLAASRHLCPHASVRGTGRATGPSMSPACRTPRAGGAGCSRSGAGAGCSWQYSSPRRPAAAGGHKPGRFLQCAMVSTAVRVVGTSRGALRTSKAISSMPSVCASVLKACSVMRYPRCCRYSWTIRSDSASRMAGARSKTAARAA